MLTEDAQLQLDHPTKAEPSRLRQGSGYNRTPSASGAGSDPRYVNRKRLARRDINADSQPVGRPASRDRANAMFELTIKLKLSYKQLHALIALFMFFFS